MCISMWGFGGAYFLGTDLEGVAQTHTQPSVKQATHIHICPQYIAPQLLVPILGMVTKRVRKGRP
jgi:hypothetical protein